ncbi:MAG: hypothetical protein L0Y71_05220 [Gemmataceae bacterium]|nr:hypothetical protein [Gemmataceae bacterium]
MLRYFGHLRISRWTRIILAVVGVSIAADSRAHAGCGEHTFVSFASFTQETSSTGQHSTSAPAQVKRTGALPCGQCPRAPLPEPCRGPSCSGQNLPDGLPTTTTTTSHRESQPTAFVAMLAACTPPDGGERHCIDDTFEPITSTDSIFHPPRMG